MSPTDTTSQSTDGTDELTNIAEPAQPDDGVTIGSQPQAGPVELQEDKGMYRAEVRAGDSQTLVVRQMVNEFLRDESKSLSAEHRLFIETVVVDSLPRNDVVSVGDIIEIEKSVLSSAVTASDGLTDSQLKLWANYL